MSIRGESDTTQAATTIMRLVLPHIAARQPCVQGQSKVPTVACSRFREGVLTGRQKVCLLQKSMNKRRLL